MAGLPEARATPSAHAGSRHGFSRTVELRRIVLHAASTIEPSLAILTDPPLRQPHDGPCLAGLLEVALVRYDEDAVLQGRVYMVGGVVERHAVALRQIKRLVQPAA